MSAAKLSLAELRDRLHSHGETAPKAWTRAQILLRLVELEGDHILKTEKEEPTPLRQWEVRLNQASKKKAELQTLLAKDLHVDVNPNWTDDMLRLKAEAAASVTPGHKNDPVGFGKWCHLKYHEVRTADPRTATGWSPRLRREMPPLACAAWPT